MIKGWKEAGQESFFGMLDVIYRHVGVVMETLFKDKRHMSFYNCFLVRDLRY